MKINYKPNGGGPAKRNPPKQWEVWLADAPFGAEGKKRCPVLVGKRGGMSYAVYEIIPSSLRGGQDVVITDLLRCGLEKPSAVRVRSSASIEMNAFVQKMGDLDQADISKCTSAMG